MRVDVKYKEPALLLRNNGAGVFDDMRELVGPAFRRSYVGRSLAIVLGLACIAAGAYLLFA